MRPGAAILALLMLLLAGCGWQLRGATGGSLEGVPVLLRAEFNAPEVERAVREGLERIGAVPVDEPEAAEAVLVLLEQRSNSRPLTVSSDAQVLEYELEYALRFRIDGPGGEPRGEPEVVSRARGYRYDSNNVLATQSREETLREDLRREVSRLLLARALALIGQ